MVATAAVKSLDEVSFNKVVGKSAHIAHERPQAFFFFVEGGLHAKQAHLDAGGKFSIVGNGSSRNNCRRLFMAVEEKFSFTKM